ncbi:UDP-N-acetylmuramate dehydrogenase [Antrihabitans cavernicola]|uniref:UDP-N-acetylenolpyruvoylglucosamine reductase n=1 Tax=Antrihabitans cavernicola TaxID=2495913 RepID=A0A5A7SBW6_9NOCA|nr:UDP-N-acetylmuramate dehydrogenase [Spelaeibacter cavernicola]KAA0022327.1 UDP-N-acetylmuramate dehydrogenase [Spelaeibacter cavernicola]
MLNPRVRDQLIAAGARLSDSVPLAGLTTLRVGGPAAVLAECESTQTLVDTVRALDAAQVPTLIVAGGSNLLISDAGFDGVVVRVANAGVQIGDDAVYAEAGAEWDAVVAATVIAGFGGLECLSGIPGSTGATPVQNVGAYGVEISGLLRRVSLLDRRSGDVYWVEPDALGLDYRTSVLKHSDHALVLGAEFALRSDGSSAPLRYRELVNALGAAEGESRPAAAVRDAVLRLRSGKGMVLDATDHDTWSAGSFFTNPIVSESSLPGVLDTIAGKLGDVAVPQFPGTNGVKLSAGWLIEQAGFGKGYPDADAAARLSTKHTLALTNRGSATATDLVRLARAVRDGVHGSFGVMLEPEPVTVGISL